MSRFKAELGRRSFVSVKVRCVGWRRAKLMGVSCCAGNDGMVWSIVAPSLDERECVEEWDILAGECGVSATTRVFREAFKVKVCILFKQSFAEDFNDDVGVSICQHRRWSLGIAREAGACGLRWVVDWMIREA